jgi:hypothetical protein
VQKSHPSIDVASPSQASAATSEAQTDPRGNAALASDVAQGSADPSIFSKMPGGEGLHAGVCGCAACLGAGDIGRSPDFTEILEDGTVVKNGAPAAASAAPAIGGPAALPGPAASPGQALQARHPDFPGTYGETFYNEADLPRFPAVTFETTRTLGLDYRCKVQKTSWGEPSFPTLCTSANAEGYKVDTVQPEHPSYAHYVIVGEKAAENTLRAEEQHLQDLFLGWNLTANAVGDAVNAEAAGEGYTAGDEITAKRMCGEAVVNRLGALGAAVSGKIKGGGTVDMAGYMNSAALLSKAKRDKSGFHSFGTELYAVDHPNKRVASKVDEKKALDTTASSAVVTVAALTGS